MHIQKRNALSRWMKAGLVLALAGCPDPGDGGRPGATYSVKVQRTAFGIPHVLAEDYGSLGYGVGYSFAQDNLCSLAEEIVTATGKRALYLEPSQANILSDVFYTWRNQQETLTAFLNAQPAQVRAAIRGYAAGYSRYVRDTGPANVDARCAGAPWVREISELDLAAVYNKAATRGGLLNFTGAIVSAHPPAGTGGGGVGPAPRLSTLASSATPLIELARINQEGDFTGGSNAYAFGAEASENGRGLLLGNPHEPWQGVQRFYQFHLTLPGELDVMGAGQQGQPFVNIGFNKDVAWSHTVSVARRFTLYQLQLVEGQPLKYIYRNASGETEQRSIERHEVTVALPNGGSHTGVIYTSHYGPMVELNSLSNQLPAWGTNNVAFSIRDGGGENLRGIEQWWRMNQATSVADLEQKVRTLMGLSFINTIAADREGNALYADLSTVPHVTQEKFTACMGSNPIRQALASMGLPALDGSTAACEWGSDADSPQQGTFGPGNLPVLTRRDYVTNSNDSYWLSNPQAPLTGFSPLMRSQMLLPEASERSLRTRMGLVQVQDRFSNADGLGGNLFSPEKLQAVFFGNRSYAAELVLDQVLADCHGADEATRRAWPASGGQTVDVTAACAALAAWDRTNNIDSRGAHVFREFWRRVTNPVWTVPFDASKPVETPNTLVINAATRAALGDAVRLFQQAGVAMDATLGSLQYVTADGTPQGERIPMHGGLHGEGVFNVATTPGPNAKGEYTPVIQGPTYMQIVTFDDAGPVATALLGFSQSADPASPHYVDQTRRYSRKEWVALPFSSEQVQQAALGEALYLKE